MAATKPCPADPEDSGAHYQFTPATQFSPVVQQFAPPSPSCAFSSPPPTSVEYMPNGLDNTQEYVTDGKNSVSSGDFCNSGVSQTSSYGVYSDTAPTNSTQSCHFGMPTGATEVAAQISQQIKHLVSRSAPLDPDLSGGGAGISTDSAMTTLSTFPSDQSLTYYRRMADASPSALSHQSLPAVLTSSTSGAAANTEYYRHRVPSSVSALSADRFTYPSSSVTPVGQFASTSANPILIRELQVAAISQLQLPQHGVNAEDSGPLQDLRVLPSRLHLSAKAAEMEVIQLPGFVRVDDPGLRSDGLEHIWFSVQVNIVAIPHGGLRPAEGLTAFGDPLCNLVVDSSVA
ncbi:unnamed protein product [Schistocephalus solidus]|uniref:Uncharacterized protein n=1 Tax=Schistocephalus solidus TaxID=70667 RepID=A0A183TQJ7_SCHSO|nr:unnamed protein product [Schistocephalus solidus]